MILGFYYHICLHHNSKGLYVPAYLGLFLDSLASEVDSLVLFMHEANQHEASQCDYILRSNNVRYITLGPKTTAWSRFLWPGLTLKKIKKDVKFCDVMLVRSPSPLAPAFYYEFRNLTKVAFLVVGDYVDSAKNLDQPAWRKLLIRILSNRNDRQLRSVIRHSLTMVNSTALFNKYKNFTPKLFEVKTTTLTKSDFYERSDTCQGEEIKILYAGSLLLSKGLMELLEASASLIKSMGNVSLHFVGGEVQKEKPGETALRMRAKSIGIDHKVFFHGHKTTGPDLNAVYRMADIYAIPSYHEGFPRTIWEAMASSLPVIATKVGSIPYYLDDRKNALLIEPKNTDQLYLALKTLISDRELRKTLIFNGFMKAKEVTLEIQSKKMIDILKFN